MDSTLKIFERYLNEYETDYAIMIDGQWGVGKTYYWLNTIVPLIEKTQFRKNESDKYKTFSISLFGIQNVKTLKKRILYHLFVEHVNSESEFYQPQLDTKDWLYLANLYPVDLSQYVICFDDLERVEDNLLHLFLGVINGLIERQHVKVVFICNDEKVQCDRKYKDYKEKLVRYTCRVCNDLPTVVKTLMKDKDSHYCEFIQSNVDVITTMFSRAGCANIRTLKFLLESFKSIYDYVSIKVEEDYRTLIGSYMLRLYTAFCLEYRNGRSNIEHIRMFSKNTVGLVSNYDFLDFGGKEVNQDEAKISDDSKEQNYVTRTQKKYFESGFYFYGTCCALAEYMITGNIDNQTLDYEANAILKNIKSKVHKPETILLQRLNNFWDSEDEEMKNVVREALDGVRKAVYPLYSYPLILLRLQKLKKFGFADYGCSDSDLYKDFHSAVCRSKKEQVDYNIFNSVKYNEDVTVEFEKLRDEVLTISKNLSMKENGIQFKNILFKTGNYEELKKYEKCFFPIFEQVSPKDFLKQYIEIRNKDKRYIYNFFEERYRDSYYISFDRAFLSSFLELLINHIKGLQLSPSRVYCEKLKEMIEKFIHNESRSASCIE